MPDAHTSVEAERAARESYGRLVAVLAARSHDIAAAEDALADAFATALEKWPAEGVPDNPEAWLLTVARRRMLDEWRHQSVVAAATDELLLFTDELIEQAEASAVPDERLNLLFICAHPAINAVVRTPLMLQTVLGLDVARMANAFLVAPATLSQRLVRAKTRIRDAGVGFHPPKSDDLPERLQDVMDAIYAAYGTGWDDVDGADEGRKGLTREAIDLGRTLAALMPHEAEPKGLLALMLFCEARAGARRDAAGRYVAFDEQDPSRWSIELINEAESHLLAAARLAAMGPYQLEAALQSAHTQKRRGAPVKPAHVLALYDGLVQMRPRVGALVSRACALADINGPDAGLAALASLREEDSSRLESYQPYWAAVAHLEARAGRSEAARQAYQRAIGLSNVPAVKDYLMTRMQALPE